MAIKRFAGLVVRNGLLLVALVVVAAVSALTTMRAVLTSQDVVVPPLAGREVSEGGALAAKHGLLLRVEGRRHDPKVPPNLIVSQEPAAGSTLKSHRSIRVWISLGPRRISVPAVEGESLRTARLTLEQSQVPVVRVVEVDDAAAEGTILVQRPPAGETDAVGEGVSLLVSRGPNGFDYLMPDLIGRRADDVLETLRRAGLKVSEVRYRTYPGVAPGIILRQVPAAGHRVNPRSALSLDISKAAP